MPEAARGSGRPLGTARHSDARATTQFLYSLRRASCSARYNKDPRRSRALAWVQAEAGRRNPLLAARRRRRPISTPRAPDACDRHGAEHEHDRQRMPPQSKSVVLAALRRSRRCGEPFYSSGEDSLGSGAAQARTTPGCKGRPARRSSSTAAAALGTSAPRHHQSPPPRPSRPSVQEQARRGQRCACDGCGVGNFRGGRRRRRRPILRPAAMRHGSAELAWEQQLARRMRAQCAAPQRRSAAHAFAMSQVLRFDCYV
jgi:hypothetical protein